ncbi:unnamed protein product [Protopolystoma xenopodis]|uniref:Uncharacterized protein n=1 Tax=Protopolystoma xenopodis TaxID=117903 RepID=A0A448WGI9_9PLAT|nr:unnamed protein product [Protopolystoma xenopodis]
MSKESRNSHALMLSGFTQEGQWTPNGSAQPTCKIPNHTLLQPHSVRRRTPHLQAGKQESSLKGGTVGLNI